MVMTWLFYSTRINVLLCRYCDRLFTCPLFFREIVYGDRWFRRPAMLVSWCYFIPPPLATGISYSPQFRMHQETTISRKNSGLWTVYYSDDTPLVATLKLLNQVENKQGDTDFCSEERGKLKINLRLKSGFQSELINKLHDTSRYPQREALLYVCHAISTRVPIQMSKPTGPVQP